MVCINMSIDDEFETPPQLFKDLCYKYRVFPKLDTAANQGNSLCERFCVDGLLEKWAEDSWCNPPHSITGKFVEVSNSIGPGTCVFSRTLFRIS